MKIIGKGFIAQNLKKIKTSNKYIIYAAGVSNSNLKNKKKYYYEVKRIKTFLKKKIQGKVIIYISTLSVNNKFLKNDLYVKNKLIIEDLIKNNQNSYIIFRLPQIVGKSKNKYTLTNSIYNSIRKNKKFVLWKGSVRNLLDIADLKFIIEKYINNEPLKNSIINLYNPRSIKIENLIKIFENILKKKAIIKVLSKKNKNVNYKNLNKKFNLRKKYFKNIIKSNYYEKTIEKYYK